jgi:hypothetical protein
MGDAGWRTIDHVREDVQRAVGLGAQDPVVDRLEVTHHQAAIGEERHAADLGREALGAERLDAEARVGGLDGQAVAGALVLAAVLVDLGARRDHAGDARLGAERRRRHELEASLAGKLPVEEQRCAARVLEHVDAETVQASGEVDAALLGGRRVHPVVHDHARAVDLQDAAVVAAELEGVEAGLGDVEVADRLDRVLVARSARTDEVGLFLEVDAVLEPVDVGRGVIGHARDAVELAVDLVDAQGVALFERRAVHRRRLGGERGHGENARDQHPFMLLHHASSATHPQASLPSFCAIMASMSTQRLA